MRSPHLGAAALSVTLFATIGAACAPPRVSDLGELREEDGILQMHYAQGTLAAMVLPDGITDDVFALRELPIRSSYDRVGVRWDAETEGGLTAVQVRIAGTSEWRTVVVDNEELVPETGRTLYAGHVDVPPGSTLETRFRLIRREGRPSPRLTTLTLEAFELTHVSEQGEPDSGDGEDAADDGGAAPPSASAPASFVTPDEITARPEWNARPPRCNGSEHDPYRMTFHETVTPTGERGAAARARMRQMQAYHQSSRGWCDIGYHFVVDADGVVYQGRNQSGRTGGHVGNQNTGNIGVSLMGTFENAAPSAAQIDGLVGIFSFMAEKWGITVDASHLRGHTEWPGQSTSCPGPALLARKSQILDDVRARLAGATGAGGSAPAAGEVIVDDASPDFVASWHWFVSTAMPTPYGEYYSARSSETVSDPAWWGAELESGSYEVFVRWTQGGNRATAAPFLVQHATGSQTVLVDQTANGSQWVSLGTYPFDAGFDFRVGLSCWTGSGDFVIADAVRFVPR